MFTTRSMHRPAVVAVLAVALIAIAAPIAAAQPTDMHASIAQATTKAHQKQDMRSPDARGAAISARKQDLNHLRAGGLNSYTPGSNSIVPASPRTLPGAPTWPVNPQPIKPAPAVHVSGSSSNGLDWTTIGLGTAGGLLLVAGIAGLAVHSRRLGRARIAA